MRCKTALLQRHLDAFIFAQLTQYGIAGNRIQPRGKRCLNLSERMQTAIRFIKSFVTQIFRNSFHLCALKHVINKSKDFTLVTTHKLVIKLNISILDFSDQLGIGHYVATLLAIPGTTPTAHTCFTKVGVKSCDVFVKNM
ncbi:hypothetical protein D3C84_910570 [compost metagenome]